MALFHKLVTTRDKVRIGVFFVFITSFLRVRYSLARVNLTFFADRVLSIFYLRHRSVETEEVRSFFLSARNVGKNFFGKTADH